MCSLFYVFFIYKCSLFTSVLYLQLFFIYVCSLLTSVLNIHVFITYLCPLITSVLYLHDCVLYLRVFFILFTCVLYLQVFFIYIGDHLVLTSTDYNPDQAEEVTILEIVNNHQVRLTGNSHINIYFSCCISLLFFLFYYFLDL